MITSNIYRIYSHCCRDLSLRVLHFDFMLVDMIAVLEKFLARHRRSTVSNESYFIYMNQESHPLSTVAFLTYNL